MKKIFIFVLCLITVIGYTAKKKTNQFNEGCVEIDYYEQQKQNVNNNRNNNNNNNDKNVITITRKELDALIKEAYDKGYNEGINKVKSVPVEEKKEAWYENKQIKDAINKIDPDDVKNAIDKVREQLNW